jgi:hypothetical protein
MSSGTLAKALLLACVNASAATVTTGVSGIVHRTPAHPGPQRIGESGRAPMAGAAVQVLDANHRVIARVTTGEDGRFSAAVPAGKYSIEVDVGAAALPRCGTAEASVRDGKVTDVEIECDSGMR